MSFGEIKTLVDALPEVSSWPELANIFERAGGTPRPDWELPIIACESVGGDASVAQPAAAAIACLQLSIMLVDDMLDDDPRGAHHRYGSGITANMALAYESAAMRLAGQATTDAEQRSAIMSSIAQAALATAAGQHLDIQNLQGEEDYWTVVAAKSTPFYGAALQVGALSGGAGAQLSARMYDLGVLIGEIIQIEDDLVDALEKPANADWQQGRNNLLILFARTADHEEQKRFLELLPLIENPEALAEAQKILISAGAVGYCALQLVQRYRAARKLLTELDLPYPSPLNDVLDDYADTLVDLLEVSGADIQKSVLIASDLPF